MLAVKAVWRAHGSSMVTPLIANQRFADEYDAAQERGEASSGGRPKSVPTGNGFTAAEIGLSRKDIHEARTIRDAVAKSKGKLRGAEGTPLFPEKAQ